MKEYNIRRYIITDLGRFDLPGETANEKKRLLHIEHYTQENFTIDFESKELDIIQFSKIDSKGNLMIASIEPIAA
jgi:hypothetical protein